MWNGRGWAEKGAWVGPTLKTRPFALLLDGSHLQIAPPPKPMFIAFSNKFATTKSVKGTRFN